MSSMTEWSHEALLAGEPRSAGLARDFVRIHLLAHHLPHLIDDMRLVVSELATNAVLHARTPFVVTLSSSSATVLLEIQDASTSAVVLRSPGVLDTSGRGMVIVELLSQEWGQIIDTRGYKHVWASFPRDG
ncbi:ATP-binding protein [Rothia sp. ARF10]|nr:ATP-binding protein [Rothia sp. ARF10]